MEDFLTIKEIAEQWGITPRRVQKMCADGRVKGAKKFGRDWAIPFDAEKPHDRRITTGNYKKIQDESPMSEGASYKGDKHEENIEK